MNSKLNPSQSTTYESQSCGIDKGKWIAVGIAPTGYIAIGIVPMGIVSIGVVPMGLISFGAVTMGLIASGLVSMGIVAVGGETMSFVNLEQAKIGNIKLQGNPHHPSPTMKEHQMNDTQEHSMPHHH